MKEAHKFLEFIAGGGNCEQVHLACRGRRYHDGLVCCTQRCDLFYILVETVAHIFSSLNVIKAHSADIRAQH